jgi:hypothetical protein
MMMLGFAANYQANAMGGILPYYRDFAQLIRSGFQTKLEFPTFPMWGYGFIYAVTDNKILIFMLQFCISLFTIYMLDRLMQPIFSTNTAKTLLRFFLLISFPWFSFNANLWPYSIAANFCILALIFLYTSFKSNKIWYAVISACLFGIVLNFRSDYYLFPLLLVFIMIIYRTYLWQKKLPTNIKIRIISLWLILTYLFLLPYAIYAKENTGHYLITSTNSGHVLFIGLGLLPDNKWGITPVDEDPEMQRLLDEEFGQGKAPHSVQYESDKFLREYLFHLVKEDPVEYMKKVAYSIYLMLRGGFFTGIYQNWAAPAEGTNQELKESLMKGDINRVLKIFQREGPLFTVLSAIQILIQACSILLFLFFNFFLLVFLYKRFYQSNYLLSGIFISIVLYQYAVCLLGYYMAGYITNLYLIYLALIFWTIDCYLKSKNYWE